jgi:hypothetical protein
MLLVVASGSALAIAAPVAVAQNAPAAVPSASSIAHLEAECARLRVELARVNREVAALKRGDRGVRGDYQLRQRMADAEALARRLTSAEAELRARTGRPAPAPAAPVRAPQAAPGDGPVELEAKADLLVDEARHLTDQATTLTRAASQIRGRQTLRRRAADLERDPFASLDGPRRTMVSGAGGTRTTGETKTAGQGGGTTATDTTSGAPAPPATTLGATPASVTPPSVPPGQAPARPPVIPGPIRTLLDPATLLEIQRLERGGRSPTDPEALDKMAAALRQRASALEAEARKVRARPR